MYIEVLVPGRYTGAVGNKGPHGEARCLIRWREKWEHMGPGGKNEWEYT